MSLETTGGKVTFRADPLYNQHLRFMLPTRSARLRRRTVD